MLVVITDVKGEHVKRAVVGVGFLGFVENVVFRNEVAGHRVDASCENSGESPVPEGCHAVVDVNKVVERELRDPVEQHPSGGWDALDEHGSKSVEAYLAEYPYGLHESSSEDRCFKFSRDVSVNSFSALVGVVVEVVSLENNAVRQDNGEVRKHTEERVLT
jgi:hypothetical protein